MSLSVFVVVATVGRAEVARRTVERLSLQTRAPDGVMVVSVGAADVEGMDQLPNSPEIAFAERGLCRQRNRSLALLKGRADVIIFFDDDFVPSLNFVEEVAKLFASRPDVVGATGRVIADGIHHLGYTVDEAVALVEGDTPPPPFEKRMEALYGCNMCVRTSAAGDLTFDEALPLYGWQEDIDFTYQLGARGVLVKNSRLSGVHMGSKAGRTPGKRLGYSQISNPVYLLRKKTMPKALAWRLMRQNLAANLVKSLRPEAHIDRRGRLAGNLLAIKDLLTGKIDPRRILELA